MNAAFPLPRQMRAIAIKRFGTPGEASCQMIDVPAPEAGELLVRVGAVGVNPADWKALMGWLPFVGSAMPLVTGFDGAGEVVAVGEGVTGIDIGDRVGFMSSIALGRSGSYAEYAVCLAANCASIPQNISLAEAATVPVAGVSAREALLSQGGVAQGQRVLVNGGSGGTGLWAMQIARAAGAHVAATAGTDNQHLLTAYGAQCAIDYRRDDVAARLAEWAPDGVDLLLDTVGQGSLPDPAALIRPGGRYVAIETMLPDEALPDPDSFARREIAKIRASASWERLRDHLEALYAAMGQGQMRALPVEQLPAACAGAALERVRAGHVRGKLVLSLQNDADWSAQTAPIKEPAA